MNDKGREAIRLVILKAIDLGVNDTLHALGFSHERANQSAGYVMSILRHNGWHHEDDIVEGKIVEEDCDGHEGCADNCGECVELEREGRPDLVLTGIKKRPATIKDMLK